MTEVRIGDEHCGWLKVGDRRRTAVMAEVGINHDGSPERALELVQLAADSGADLVKFQYIDPAAMVHRPALPELYALYSRYALPLEDYRRIVKRCRLRKIPFVCTVFDLEGAARMVEIGVSAFKVASCDMTHLPLLRSLGQYGLPVILSTGLADIGEVAAAVRELKKGGCRTPVLLHCVSAYPAPPAQVNLTAMNHLRRRFRLPVGYSDHTRGTLAPALAVALGACLIEKHFTHDPLAPGPDHALSLGPDSFRRMVEEIRLAEAMRGDGRKKPADMEKEERRVGRRGYYLVREVKKGEKVRLEDLIALKPWTAVGPFEVHRLRGAVYARDLAGGSPLGRDDVIFRKSPKLK
ncbi:MAG: N-acetylneuraminate synthase family protein [Candidatus Glassbacteria bacterium]